jgi:hypothetical protein
MSGMDLNQKIQIHPLMGFHGTEYDNPLPLVILAVLVGVRAGRWWNLTRRKLTESISIPIIWRATITISRTLRRVATIAVSRALRRVATIWETVASRTIPTPINGFQFS